MLALDIEKKLAGFHLRVALEAQENVLVLFGPSGSGKSLTLQCIAGLMEPDAGRIAIGGRMVFDLGSSVNVPASRRRVGYVFQHLALFPHLSVGANVAFGLHRLARKERAARVEEALALVRLEGLERQQPGELSGGQQQRVALARALVTQPDVLLLDEPFASLDTLLREQLRTELLALLRETSIPSVLVTHDLDEAYALGREIAVYDAGQVLQFGPREEVYHRPASRRVAELVGMKNILPGIVQEIAHGLARIAGPGDALWAPAGTLGAGDTVECCIRPEEITLQPGPPPEGEVAPGQSWVACVLLEAVSYGSQVALVFRPEANAAAQAAPRLHVTLSAAAFRELAAANPRHWSLGLDARHIHIIAAPRPAALPGCEP